MSAPDIRGGHELADTQGEVIKSAQELLTLLYGENGVSQKLNTLLDETGTEEKGIETATLTGEGVVVSISRKLDEEAVVVSLAKSQAALSQNMITLRVFIPGPTNAIASDHRSERSFGQVITQPPMFSTGGHEFAALTEKSELAGFCQEYTSDIAQVLEVCEEILITARQ